MSDPDHGADRGAGWRILIAGTGGQGVILAARLLTRFFVQLGHQVVSGQLHGMAQRGGAVQSTVMVNRGVSPAIPRGGADFVLGFEPVETARALPFISARSMVLMNTAPIVPYALSQQYVRGQGTGEYPDVGRLSESIRAVTRALVTLDATALAERTGSIKTLNVVMLGCLFGAGAFPFAPDDFMNTVMKTAPAMLARANMDAFQCGVEFGQSVQLVGEVS